jgi:hypothetical protein
MVVEEAPEAPAVPLSAPAIGGDSGERDGPAWSAAEQALLARTLITTWALATGRTLRSDVPPWWLSAAELIDFWADPLTVRGDPG